MSNYANWGKVLQRANQSRQIGNSAFKKGNQDAMRKLNNQLHVSVQRKYPVAAALPIPANIDPAETTRFSPHRSRDISATAILSHQSSSLQQPLDVTLDNSVTDPHVMSYDCFGAVSLTSVMQSNVPSPFGGMHKFTHLNMPGGQWSQESKFMSHDLNNSHYTNLRREARAEWSKYDENATYNKGIIGKALLLDKKFNRVMLSMKNNNSVCNSLHEQIRNFSTDPNLTKSNESDLKTLSNEKLSRKDRFKKAIKEYGSTVIVFHIGISLISLEIFYLLVSSGVDVMPIINFIGLGATGISNKIATGASTFVIAYAVHKVFAPIRISITLAATPIIVRYLRKKGFLKTSKPI